MIMLALAMFGIKVLNFIWMIISMCNLSRTTQGRRIAMCAAAMVLLLYQKEEKKHVRNNRVATSVTCGLALLRYQV